MPEAGAARRNVEALLLPLHWITLALATLGFIATLAAIAQRDGRASTLLLLFGGLAGHQALVAFDPPTGAIAFDSAGLQAVAMLAIALGGLAGLWALARVSRERNGAEELHWDAMETLRAVNELSLPGAPKDALPQLLALGERRFELSFGVVLRKDESDPAAFHVAPGVEIDRAAIVAALQRYAEWSSDRPFIDDAPDPSLPAPLKRVFIAVMHLDGEAIGNLAFGSLAPAARKLTATDKDLLAMLANSAARMLAPRSVELLAAPPPAPAPTFVDRLRERLSGAAVELALDPTLEDDPAAEIPLEDIAYGLACGARLVSATGTLRVESGSIQPPQGGSHFITLTVRIDDPDLDASALNGVSATGNASLEALGKQLRAHGGDVSMSVESGVGASMTAFVPVSPASGDPPPPPDPSAPYLS